MLLLYLYCLLCICILGKLTKLWAYSFGLCSMYLRGSQEDEGLIMHIRDEQFFPNPDPVPEPVPNRTEFKNMGWYLVLLIHKIRDLVPPVPVLVLKIGTIPGTNDFNSVRYSGLIFDRIRFSGNREWYGSVPVPSHAHP